MSTITPDCGAPSGDFVRGGVEHGVIRVQQYTGTLEDDLAAAAYSVAREDPAGAYAVDYMTHECTLIVSLL